MPAQRKTITRRGKNLLLVFPDCRQKDLQEHQPAQIISAAQISWHVERNVGSYQADDLRTMPRHDKSCVTLIHGMGLRNIISLSVATRRTTRLPLFRQHRPPENISGYAPCCDFPSASRQRRIL